MLSFLKRLQLDGTPWMKTVDASDESATKRLLINGTYVHPALIPHIASWVDPTFGRRLSSIINDYTVRDFKQKYAVKHEMIRAVIDLMTPDHEKARAAADRIKEFKQAYE